MLLSQLSAGAASIEIAALAYDSRLVTPGTLFFCVPGQRSDGVGGMVVAVAALTGNAEEQRAGGH